MIKTKTTKIVSKRALKELQGMIKKPKTTGPAAASKSASAPGILVVAANARHLQPQDLPLSVRLDGIFRKKSYKKLGDLNGVPVKEIYDVQNCGVRTIRELNLLLERAAAGEFDSPKAELAKLNFADMLRQMDHIAASIPDDKIDVLYLRLGGSDNRVRTLLEVSPKYQITRERVRQIGEEALAIMRRSGGPKLASLMNRIVSRCTDAMVPLTPALLDSWVGRGYEGRKFPTHFYVRLLGLLNPTLPVWPRGQEGGLLPTDRARKIVNTLKAVLPAGGVAVPARAAFKLLVSKPGLKNLTWEEMYSALRRAQSVTVSFTKPDVAEIAAKPFRPA
jgi:hypothetical protein